MNCSTCRHENPVDSAFCEECGTRLERRCPSCGSVCAPAAKFCRSCGASLVARLSPATDDAVARKVVTIVFADLIGSTSLHERLDPESVSRVMERYHRAVRAPVEAHGGTVVQLLGDGVMCAFGVPQVAEDDAIRAVRAAVSIQQAFREFAREHVEMLGNAGLRVAVNTGEVVVSDDYAAGIGDPLNVAARLQQEAQDGDVLIGESTQRLVSQLVTLAPFGVLSLKGRAETVTAYRVVSLDRPAGVSATAFVGRDSELRRLMAVYDSAVATPAARLAVILGSPGLGKSRLLDELARRLAGATVLTASCEASAGATFAPIAKALRTLLRVDGAAGGDDLRTAIEAAVPGDDADRGRIIDGLAALLAATPASPEETFFVVRRLLARLAAIQPVVLAIDDLQWAEPLLLDLIEHLVQWSTDVPLLLLVAARPELREARSSLAAPGGLVAEVVMLAGLDAGAATRLAANVIGGDELPAAVAGRVLATSEGNPLFVGELVRMLVHDGALKREGDRWTTGVELAALEMPPTIQALLAARIERLRPEERTVLERAAVVGRQFSRAAVTHLLPREVTDLDARLESLRRSELIEPDAGWFLGEPVLRFHHVLIRDAAYRRLLKNTRAELHGRFAEWLEARVGESVEHDETIGWHLEQAHQHLRELGPLDEHGRALGERAARYLAAAGRRALARDDLPVAGNLLGRALDRLEGADPTRADLALDWCEALLAAGDVGHAAQAIAELGQFIHGSLPLEKAGQDGFESGSIAQIPLNPPLSKGEARDRDRLRAWHTCFAGQLAVLTDPQALRATADAVAAAADELAAAGDAAGEAKAHSVHADALSRLGQVGACEAALDRALAAARRANDRRRSNAVLAGAPLAALWGPSPVTRASGRCLDVMRVLRITQGAPAVEAVALRCQGVLEALRGRTEAARRMIAASRRMVEELGLTQGLLETEMSAGLIELIEGDDTAAERSLRTAYEGFRDHGLGIDAARAAALLGRSLLPQGRAAEAEALSHESEALAGDDLQAAITWRRVRAEALALRGEHASAVELARAAVDIAAATDALLHHADARLALAAALRAAGRQDEAAAEQARAMELWESKGATVLADRTRLRPEAFGGRARSGAGRIVEVDRARGERAAPARPAYRRVGGNDATVSAARFVAAMAAGNVDAISALVADDLTVVHHPTGVEYDREGLLVSVHSHLRAREPTYQLEPLAILGTSLALFRQLVSSLPRDELAIGAAERVGITLMEVDAQGRNRHTEYFGADRLGDAVARLYERYAELLPDGPARIRAAATARSVAAMLAKRAELDRWVSAFAPDIEHVDHRTVGFGGVLGAHEFRAALATLFELSDDVATRIDGIHELRSDALLLRWTNFGTQRAGGGAYERPFLWLAICGAAGLLTRIELFDPDREADALARFDELTGDVLREGEPPGKPWAGRSGSAGASPSQAARPSRAGWPARRVRANAATANAAREADAIATGDADAFPGLLAADVQVVHRPTGTVFDRAGVLTSWQGLLAVERAAFGSLPLATLGDGLALCRVRASWRSVPDALGEEFAAGPGELEELVLIEVDPEGRRRQVEVFAHDCLADAIARLYERYAEILPEGPERTRAAASARSVAALLGPPDQWPFAADVETTDHRIVGFGSLHGAEAVVEAVRALVQLSDDLAYRIDDVLGLRSDALLVRWTNSGTDRASGGAFERSLCELWVFGADGLVTRWEQFDAEQDAEALARFDELVLSPVEGLTAEPPVARPVRRRVRPNAATATAARADAAIAARDVDAFLAAWAEGAEVIDHPIGTAYGLQELGDTWRRALLRAPDLEYRGEEMATLGEALGLFRHWVRASASAGGRFDVGDYEIGQVFLNEVDEQGRCRRSERFGADRLGDAITRLYERYAELLPDGPARDRAAATARSVAALPLAGPHDGPANPDRLVAALAPSVEWEDPRTVGFGTLQGAEAVLRASRALLDLLEGSAFRVDDILALRSDALLVRWTHSAIDRAGGGAIELQRLMLWVFGVDGLLTRWVQFDAEQESEALARFDELTNGGFLPLEKGGQEGFDAGLSEQVPPNPPLAKGEARPRRRVRPNAATANAARVDAAIAAQDVDAFPTLWADESETVGHETHTTWDRQGSLAAWRSMPRVRDAKSRHKPLATLGDSLALCRWSTSGSGFAGRNFDVGAYEREEITLVEVDAQGRRRRTEAFPVDRLGDAVVRLYERYAHLLPDSPQRARTAATARSVAGWVGPFDLDRAAAPLAPTLESVDHRPLGTWFAQGKEALLEHVRALVAVAEGIVLRDDDVLGLRSDALLVRRTHRGTDRASGGAYERAYLMLLAFDADGLATRFEWFDLDREAEALARFDELTEPTTTSSRQGSTGEGSVGDPLAALAKPNAATAARDRAEAAFEARDWAALRGLLAVNAKFEDRRRHVLVSVDVDGWIAERRRWARSGAHSKRRLHGTAGDRVALERVLVTSGPGGGRSEFEHLSLTAVDDGGRIVAGVVFHLDDWRAAYREAWARWFAADAAAAAVMAPIFESAEGWNDHDGARVRKVLADSVVVNDRRRAGMGLLEGADAYVEALVPLWNLAPDVQIEPRFLLALEPHGMVSAGRIFGTFPEGGPFEGQLVWVFIFAGGRITRLEIFEIEDVEAALARFAELRPPSVSDLRPTCPDPLCIPPNAAVRAGERARALIRARNWEGCRALASADFTYEDRRKYVLVTGGVEVWIRSMEEVMSWPSFRVTYALIGTAGDRIMVERGVRTGKPDTGAFEIELIRLIEVAADGRLVAWMNFDVEDRGAALAEAHTRFAAGEAAAVGGQAPVGASLWAFRQHDWHAFRECLTPDLALRDHRPPGLFTLDQDEWISSLRAQAELVPDLDAEVLRILAWNGRGCTDLVRVFGTRDGGAFENVFIRVLMTEGAHIQRYEIFDVGDADRALARFEELCAEGR